MNSKERAAARRNDKVARTVFQDIHPDREPSLSGSGYRNSTALTVTSPSTASTRPHSTSSPHPLQPADDPINLTRLGLSLEARGQMDGARAAYLRAIAADPRFIPARLGLGNLLHRQHHDREAEMAFREAITQDHGNKDSWTGLGLSLQHQGQLDAALAAFRQAAQVGPANAAAHCNLGTLLFALDHNDEALAELNHALQLDSHYASAHGNLGALLARAGRPIAAEVASRAAIGFAPNEHRWLTNLGVALLSQGRYAEAEASYRKALAMQPGYASGHGNLLFALNYRPDVTADAVFAEYREWDRRHAKPLAPSTQGQAMAPGSVSRLRIGYVSADFRQHAVAMFAEPLLRAHDRANVELYLYADVASEDSTTHRFRSLCDHWHSTIGLSDAQLDQLIRGDKIDVLIDLAGHSAANRLLTFARRPAPVQVAYLLGHGYTTGLSAMDVFLADEHLAPPGSEALFSERLIRLDRIPIVYAPPDDMPPVAPLPVSLSGSITFGHFGRTERLNEYVVAAWARILHAVPGSRLVLNNRPFQEPAFRDMFLKRFNNHGIESSRLELICTAPQSETWMAYARIDIALDPFPHNAGTTTIEALWQGVPVVSLAGRASVGRFGTSILHAAGLDDWVTTNVDDYVARAAAAASDLPALALLRQTLRQRINASPLCDATGLASTLEAVYRRLYEEKYGGNRQALHQLYASGDSAAASDLAEEILGKDSGDATAHHVLGLLAYQAGHFHTADVHLSKALVRSHGLAELHANHAAILRKLGRLTDAETAARTALTLEPERVGAHNNLGNILRDAGRYEESGDCYRTAVRLEPGFTEAWINLSWVLTLGGRTQQGEAAARRAIACDPNNADGHNNLGLALTRQGRLAEAEAALRRALALRPDFALPHSNILFCLNYHPTMPASEIFAEYQRWDRQHAIALRPADPRFENDRLPHRRLRVGYVSPDFRQHAAALFAEPLLSAHDRSVIELYCYAEVAAPDAVTERFRVLADHWHNSVGLSDSDLAEQIRKDRIDILVDIAGHTAGNRLLAFARKPAPVQVTWLLGHGYTSGLSVMDAFLADDELAPPGAEALFSESLVRLSRIPLAYAPPTNMPDTAPLPARIKGYITFGYFGRTVRLNDLVLSAWARILAALPSARLMLNSAPFSEPAGRDQMAARFATLGIDRERLDLTCTTPQPRTWAAYGEVDIALDPFPHNAGTTTFEALWQGVPVVTLAGRPSVGRFGASILHAAGLDSWIAQDVDDYVACAVEGAGDLEALSLLRAELRARVAASPLCDAAGLALEMEQAYRTLWQRWCVSHAPDVRQLYSAGRVDEAIRLAEARLRDDPYDDAALHVCALARFALADIPAAVALLRRASQCKPSAAILSDLGVMLRAMGQPGEAEAAYRHALHLEPTLAQALGNLGNLLLDQHRHEEAESCLNDALGQTPNGPWLLRSLALCQMARGAAAEAESALRRAIEVDPSDPDAHDTLGALLGQSGRPIEAESHHRDALPRSAQRHRVLSNLAITLQTQGRHVEAEQCCRQALAAQPDYSVAHANLLFSLNYRKDLPPEAIFQEYQEWNRRHAIPLASQAQRGPLDRTPGRRLRVGYVSADLRQHPVAWFARPLLAAHDRSQVEVFCYSATAAPDAITSAFRSLADNWRDIAGQSDAAAADMIRDDHIDILVDMSGHTAGSRLLVFARKPAPVQVCYLLGHGYTSGLTAMDAFLADSVLVPDGAEALFSERVIRLPRIPLAYAPDAAMPPVGPLPAAISGHVTFGYFGRLERLNDTVIATWSAILQAIPDARLVLNNMPFREAAFRSLIAGRFAAHGIPPSRLELVATAPQSATWTAYGGIDIALDPFPHNAGTTTIEALWLGVPVITLAGRPSVGRFGAMILQAVGMTDWISQDADGYVAHAIATAADLPGLARVRASLRQRVAASPLCDAAGLARAVEAAFRDLWASC